MSGLEDIPLVGGIAETAIHAGSAIGDAVSGDWDGAAHEAFGMAGSALHTVADDLTGGAFGAAEGVYDAAAGGLGLPTSDDISHTIEGGVQDLGNALGDGVYNLLNPSDDSGQGGGLSAADLSTESQGDSLASGGGDMSADPGDGGADGGYDPSMDGGDMGGGDAEF